MFTSAAIKPSGAAVHEALSADLTGAVFARLFAAARSPQRLVRVEAHEARHNPDGGKPTLLIRAVRMALRETF